VTYYLMHAATGAPALAVTFDTIDEAYTACERHFGACAWGDTVLVASFTNEDEETP
jgi:hypothetical protein